MVTVCAWCVKTEAEEDAYFRGEPVSHGICDVHYQELLGEIHGCGAVSGDPTRAGLALAPIPSRRSERDASEISASRGAQTPATHTGSRSESIS